jgi:hypothetical protein
MIRVKAVRALGLFASGYRVLSRFKNAKMIVFVVCPDTSYPFAYVVSKIDAGRAGRVVLAPPHILMVLSAGNHAKIFDAVVGWVAINMVNMPVGP